MIAVIVVAIELPKSSASILLSHDPWAGSYVVLDSDVDTGTTGISYSRNGTKIGKATFEWIQGGWTITDLNH
jgi:hypothetical protein